MNDLLIRPIERGDRDAWHILWRDYLVFYESSVNEAVYHTTFERFFDKGLFEPNCLVAERNGELVGLVHFLYHRHNWHIENVCYLQDLFVAEKARGAGVARKLIEAVYGRADKDRAAAVYWLTQDFNEDARKLYDKVAKLAPFIKYQR